jgi:hypothetical protein
MRVPFALAALALLAEGLARPAPAQEVLGQITVTIDTQDHIWHTLLEEDENIAQATHFSDFGFIWQVQIEGRDSGDGALPGNLQIVFSGIDGETRPNERVIIFDETATGKRFVSADEDVDAVIVDRLDLTNGDGFAEGSLGAALCRRDGVFATPDPEDCVTIMGRFASRLPIDG